MGLEMDFHKCQGWMRLSKGPHHGTMMEIQVYQILIRHVLVLP
jgi:hypothetical protein